MVLDPDGERGLGGEEGGGGLKANGVQQEGAEGVPLLAPRGHVSDNVIDKIADAYDC